MDSSNHSWTGYKAVQDQVTKLYSFESSVTGGLNWTEIQPIATHIYDSSALIELKSLYTSIIPADGLVYYLPLESLMSYNYDNLFIIGRCLGAEFKAQGALRVQNSCASMGVGVAKYLINKTYQG